MKISKPAKRLYRILMWKANRGKRFTADQLAKKMSCSAEDIADYWEELEKAGFGRTTKDRDELVKTDCRDELVKIAQKEE